MTVRVINADCREALKTLDAESVQTCVTSPPYFQLRNYKVAGQMGMEKTPEAFVDALVDVMREVWRVLRDDGTLWLNIGDSYASQGGPEPHQTKWQITGASDGQNGGKSRKVSGGLKSKDLMLIPFRLALALQADGWWVRSDIVWSKPNPMPESVTDRPTRAHEFIFLLSKSQTYFYDAAAIREPAKGPTTKMPDGWDTGAGAHGSYHRNGREKGGPVVDKKRGHGRRHDGFNDRWDQMTKEEQQECGANKRDIWTVATQPYPDAHFATFPEALIEPCILAGSAPGDTVLDPFAGSGTTLRAASKHRRNAIGIELNPEYCKLIDKRTSRVQQTLPMEEAV